MNDDSATSLFGDEEPRTQRSGRLVVGLAAAALVLALLTLLRGCSLDSRLDALALQSEQLDAGQATLLTEIRTLAEREAQARGDMRRQIESLLSLSRDVAALEATTAELQDRSALPQRSWARAEALALLELAGRQLKVERNADAAIEAMAAADARLAQLNEPVLNTVRRALTAELETLRSFPRPDIAAITEQLRRAETAAATLPALGIRVESGGADPGTEPAAGPLTRAWQTVRQTLANLIVIRRTDPAAGALLTDQDQNLKRQRLQLLLLGARVAVMRGDQTAFTAALAETRSWLGSHFDADDAEVAQLEAELTRLESTDIAPPLPDISGSLKLLRQLVPLTRPAA